MKHPFEYQKPTAAQVIAMATINTHLRDAYDAILAEVPSARERALAITNLQQARMWANAAIVLADD